MGPTRQVGARAGPGQPGCSAATRTVLPRYTQKRDTELEKSYNLLSFRQRADSESVQSQREVTRGTQIHGANPTEKKKKKSNTTENKKTKLSQPLVIF